MKKFPTYRQLDMMDCGPTCVRMIAKYYGKNYTIQYLRKISHLTRQGVSMLGISDAAEKIGFKTLGVKSDIKKLKEDVTLPCVLHWQQNHFVVLYKIKKDDFFIADPASGKVKVPRYLFEKNWMGKDSRTGTLLLFDVTPGFYSKEETQIKSKKGFRFLFRYLRPYRSYIFQLFLSVIVGGLFSLIFPFLTQSIVDYGITNKDISFISLILISQLVLFVGSTSIDLIRSWLLLHMNNRINISIISDFLIKLMKLPISYFDTVQLGDIKQRIADHNRIQSFLTGTTLSTVFSLINLVIFTIVLGIYSMQILGIYLVFSILGIIWIISFLKKRKELDYASFQQMGDRENILVELIEGMPEIKLNNCEKNKRWSWENMQARIYKLSMKRMAIGQYQSIGSASLNQLKNILITYFAASQVINGNMTLGMMMAVSYMIGQLNSPINQLLGLVQSIQDTKISLDRLGEIHNHDDEDSLNKKQTLNLLDDLEKDGDSSKKCPGIVIENVSYQYHGFRSPYVLKDINLVIPKGKVTAIVGTSGSGKTTLLKLLLNIYKAGKGKIEIDGVNIDEISAEWWRSKCGTVMQEGYLFSDTIGENISISDEVPDMDKIKHSVEVANIKDFIEEMPLGYNSKIGRNGAGISTGQKQRMLIARAVYKNPEYLFFDEATSSLDANNEKTIMKNLQEFYKGKTVVIVAHRLSTVKNADQIIVLENGSLKEVGCHSSLVEKKGKYYELVKNQLELAS